MITDFQTNAVFFSSLLPAKCPVLNAHITEALRTRGVPFGYLEGTKDIWCRDYMPIQIDEDPEFLQFQRFQRDLKSCSASNRKARWVSYNYTPDYLKGHRRLQTNPEEVSVPVAKPLSKTTTASNKQKLPVDVSACVPAKTTKIDLVLDGGNVVKCGDAVVMTEKVFVENRDKSRLEVERILRDAFRCDVLFLPWDREEYLGHSDGIVHYAGDGRVQLTNYGDFSPYFYRRFRKALETRFEVVPLRYKVKRKHARSWAYINFLQVGNLVLVPQLSSKFQGVEEERKWPDLEEDEQAIEQIANAMPGCEVVGIPALEAVRKGGALNCISWNIQK